MLGSAADDAPEKFLKQMAAVCTALLFVLLPWATDRKLVTMRASHCDGMSALVTLGSECVHS